MACDYDEDQALKALYPKYRYAMEEDDTPRYCEECGEMMTDDDFDLPCDRDLCNHCYLHLSDDED